MVIMKNLVDINLAIRDNIMRLEEIPVGNIVNTRSEILDSLERVYKAKNADYGDAADLTFLKFGIDSYLVRMFDKINRLQTLCSGRYDIQVDEKLTDTAADLINYCFMMFASIHTYDYDAAVTLLNEKHKLTLPRHYNNFDMTIWNPEYVDIIMDDLRNVKLDITYIKGYIDGLEDTKYRNVRVEKEDLPRVMLHLSNIIDNCLTYITSVTTAIPETKVEERP